MHHTTSCTDSYYFIVMSTHNYRLEQLKCVLQAPFNNTYCRIRPRVGEHLSRCATAGWLDYFYCDMHIIFLIQYALLFYRFKYYIRFLHNQDTHSHINLEENIIKHAIQINRNYKNPYGGGPICRSRCHPCHVNDARPCPPTV
jgi:hypothetical protein